MWPRQKNTAICTTEAVQAVDHYSAVSIVNYLFTGCVLIVQHASEEGEGGEALHSIHPFTWKNIFSLSRGAVNVRETAPAPAPASSCRHHMPDRSSGMRTLSLASPPMLVTYTQE